MINLKYIKPQMIREQLFEALLGDKKLLQQTNPKNHEKAL
jgi:hypothetical protein